MDINFYRIKKKYIENTNINTQHPKIISRAGITLLYLDILVNNTTTTTSKKTFEDRKLEK